MTNIEKIVILADYNLEIEMDRLLEVANTLQLDEELLANGDYSVAELVELDADIAHYIYSEEVLEIMLSNGEKCSLSNLDLADLFSWKDYCEGMCVSWCHNFMSLFMNIDSGQYGIIAIWECNKKEWVYCKEESHVSLFFYYPFLDRFLGLTNVREWGFIFLEVFIMNPTNFETETIFLHHFQSENNVGTNEKYVISNFDCTDLFCMSHSGGKMCFDNLHGVCFISAIGGKGKEYYFKIPYSDIREP